MGNLEIFTTSERHDLDEQAKALSCPPGRSSSSTIRSTPSTSTGWKPTSRTTTFCCWKTVKSPPAAGECQSAGSAQPWLAVDVDAVPIVLRVDREVDPHQDAALGGPAHLMEPGRGESAATADVEFAPRDLLSRLGDHRASRCRSIIPWPFLVRGPQGIRRRAKARDRR